MSVLILSVAFTVSLSAVMQSITFFIASLMTLYWMPLYWVSLCWMSLCWILCWLILSWASQCCLYAERLYAECRNAGCHYAERRGAIFLASWLTRFIFIKVKRLQPDYFLSPSRSGKSESKSPLSPDVYMVCHVIKCLSAGDRSWIVIECNQIPDDLTQTLVTHII